jgi:hypothetical protein
LPDTTRIYASIDLTFSPDGQRVSLVYDRHVYVLDVASGAWVIEAEPFPELNVYWTDDSTMLYGFEIDPIPVRRDALTSLLPDSRIPPREFLSATGVLSWAKGGDAWDLRTGQPVPPPIGAPSPVSVLPGFEATSHGYAVVSESRRRTELIPVSPHGAVAFYPGGYAELLGDATLDAAQVFCDFCGSEAPAEVCTEQQLVAGHYAAALRGESPIWP